MADTRIEKPNTPPEGASKEAVTEAADPAPVVIPTAADRELSDDDLDRVSGGTADAVRPQVRKLL
jgi:hypothetical protein